MKFEEVMINEVTGKFGKRVPFETTTLCGLRINPIQCSTKTTSLFSCLPGNSENQAVKAHKKG